MPSFYMRSCINKSIFFLSFKCIYQREENQSQSTTLQIGRAIKCCQRGEIKCSSCLHLLKKQHELCHCSGTLTAKVQGLRRVQEASSQTGHQQHSTTCPAAARECGGCPLPNLSVTEHADGNCWYCFISQGSYLWRKMISNLCRQQH